MIGLMREKQKTYLWVCEEVSVELGLKTYLLLRLLWLEIVEVTAWLCLRQVLAHDWRDLYIRCRNAPLDNVLFGYGDDVGVFPCSSSLRSNCRTEHTLYITGRHLSPLCSIVVLAKGKNEAWETFLCVSRHTEQHLATTCVLLDQFSVAPKAQWFFGLFRWE